MIALVVERLAVPAAGRYANMRREAACRGPSQREQLLGGFHRQGSLENARAVPRWIWRGNWSSTTIRARHSRGVASQSRLSICSS